MKKNFNWIKSLMAMMIVALVATGCNDDDDGGGATADQTMMEIIESESGGGDGLDSLARYLENFPEITAELNASGEATFFAPTNSAFISLLQVTGSSISITDLDPEIVKAVLEYHLVPDETITSGELSGGDILSTSYTDNESVNQVITVNDNGSLKSGSPNSAIEIVDADLMASNGVVHKIEDVMLPPSLSEGLTPLLGTLAGTVTLASEFSYLEAFIQKADSEVPDGEDSVLVILREPGSYTAFAPPNAVFETLAGSEDPATVQAFIDGYNAADARELLMTHISASGALTAGDLTDGATITTLSGVTLTVTVEDEPTDSPTGILISSPGSQNIPVLETDVVHTNGVAHVLGGILLP